MVVITCYKLTLTDCYTVLTDHNGVFGSNNYPYSYDSNTTCYWLITVSDSSVVSLTFTDLNVESPHDVVSIYDGATTDSRLLLTASNNFTTYPVLSPTVVSSTNEMLVVFTSNEAIELQGFLVTYFSVMTFRVNQCQ